MNGISCVQNVSAILQRDEKNQDFQIRNKKSQAATVLNS